VRKPACHLFAGHHPHSLCNQSAFWSITGKRRLIIPPELGDCSPPRILAPHPIITPIRPSSPREIGDFFPPGSPLPRPMPPPSPSRAPRPPCPPWDFLRSESCACLPASLPACLPACLPAGRPACFTHPPCNFGRLRRSRRGRGHPSQRLARFRGRACGLQGATPLSNDKRCTCPLRPGYLLSIERCRLVPFLPQTQNHYLSTPIPDAYEIGPATRTQTAAAGKHLRVRGRHAGHQAVDRGKISCQIGSGAAVPPQRHEPVLPDLVARRSSVPINLAHEPLVSNTIFAILPGSVPSYLCFGHC